MKPNMSLGFCHFFSSTTCCIISALTVAIVFMLISVVLDLA